MKKEAKEQATALRKRGFSYKEIAKYVNVSVSTVSLWLKDETWSQKITEDNHKRAARDNSKRIALLNKARNNQYKRLYAEAERSAATEYKHYKDKPLFIAGLMLYVAEGDNRDSGLIRLASTNMQIHAIFIGFLIEYLGVSREKIRFWTLLYPDHDPERVSRTWSKELKLPLSQFHKYQVIDGRSTKPKLQYGVGNTIIGSAVLKRKLMKWIELTLNEINN